MKRNSIIFLLVVIAFLIVIVTLVCWKTMRAKNENGHPKLTNVSLHSGAEKEDASMQGATIRDREADLKTERASLSDLKMKADKSGFSIRKSRLNRRNLDDKTTTQIVREIKIRLIPNSFNKAISIATASSAYDYLNENFSMAQPPTEYAETNEYYFFSGGLSSNANTNFSEGVAIRKDDGAILTWSELDKPTP